MTDVLDASTEEAKDETSDTKEIESDFDSVTMLPSMPDGISIHHSTWFPLIGYQPREWHVSFEPNEYVETAAIVVAWADRENLPGMGFKHFPVALTSNDLELNWDSFKQHHLKKARMYGDCILIETAIHTLDDDKGMGVAAKTQFSFGFNEPVVRDLRDWFKRLCSTTGQPESTTLLY